MVWLATGGHHSDAKPANTYPMASELDLDWRALSRVAGTRGISDYERGVPAIIHRTFIVTGTDEPPERPGQLQMAGA